MIVTYNFTQIQNHIEKSLGRLFGVVWIFEREGNNLYIKNNVHDGRTSKGRPSSGIRFRTEQPLETAIFNYPLKVVSVKTSKTMDILDRKDWYNHIESFISRASTMRKCTQAVLKRLLADLKSRLATKQAEDLATILPLTTALNSKQKECRRLKAEKKKIEIERNRLLEKLEQKRAYIKELKSALSQEEITEL